MPCPEMQEWKAFYQVEPFGAERDDLRVGYAAARLAGIWAGGKHCPADFMPDFNIDKRENTDQSEQEMLNLVSQVFTEVKTNGNTRKPGSIIDGKDREI